jgi:hypothetical protein
MTETAEETALAPRITSATIGFGLSASNWEEGFKIAKVLADSDLVPKAYQGKPADVVVAMQYGAEIGLPPMASLQSLAVINGKPGLYGDGFLAVIQASANYVKHREYYLTPAGEVVHSLRNSHFNHDDTRAVCEFYRRGVPEPFVREFSIGDAKRAKLWGKEGPWTNYPARQLQWRARGFAGRDGFAAELRGMNIVTALEDMPPDDAPERPPLPTPREVRPAPEEGSSPSPAPTPTRRPASRSSSAPTPATRPASSGPLPPTVPAGTTSLASLVITATAYVTPKDEEAFYEVKARVAAEGQAPIGYVFLTRNKDLFELAQSAEGTPQTFTVTWSPGVRKDGSPAKVLQTIVAS